MTATPQTPPPAPMTPVTPAWSLYVYGTRAFLTFDARLIAEATVTTPAQEARITGVFHRLATHTTQQGVTNDD